MHVNKLLIIPGALVSLTTISGLLLSSTITHADGNTSSSDAVSVTVDTACTMTGGPTGESTTDNTYTATIDPGTYSEISGSKLVTLCNDNLGYSLYAIGFSGDSYDSATHTDLIGSGSIGNIQTGTSGTNSYWAMKLEAVSGVTPPTILNDFDNYHVIPSSYTQIAKQETATGSPTDAGASVQTKYKVNISSSQTAGTYQGKVKYTMVHPNTAPAPTPPPAPSADCNTPVPNLTYMQDLNSSNKATVLTSMTEDSQYYLRDKRDEKPYCVAKLKDGNIWMTQNLDHDIKTDGSVAYTPATTDVLSTWTPSTATYPTGTTTWNGSTTAPESYDPGELYWSGTPDDTTPVSTGNSHYHLGNYYNWTAAVAMNNSSSYTTDQQDVNQSICPANWTLPKSGNVVTTSGSFQYLVTQYGWDSSSGTMTNPNIWNSPIKASLSGFWGGSLGYVGSLGTFWSPMVLDSYLSYSLYAFSGGGVDPDGGVSRGGGLSVRCLARW